MAKIRKVTPQVEKILEEMPETRDDDRELILQVYARYYDVWLGDRFYKIMRKKDLPPFESIRRARQKIQAKRPDLRASEDVEAIRFGEQLEYIKFAREE